MTIEKRQLPVVETNPFPNSVANEERRVKDRDLGLMSTGVLTVDVDQNIFVSLVGDRLVGRWHEGTLAHGVIKSARHRRG